jgi:hypothetical protein
MIRRLTYNSAMPWSKGHGDALVEGEGLEGKGRGKNERRCRPAALFMPPIVCRHIAGKAAGGITEKRYFILAFFKKRGGNYF